MFNTHVAIFADDFIEDPNYRARGQDRQATDCAY